MEPETEKQTTLECTLFEGRLRLEKRHDSPYYSARTYLKGRLYRGSTGESTKDAAKKKASEWYLKLLARDHGTDPTPLPPPKPKTKKGVLFETAFNSFIEYMDREEEVGPLQRRNYRHKMSVLKQYLDGVTLQEIDLTWLQTLRKKRKASKEISDDGHGRKRRRAKKLSNVTIKKDLNFIRLVMRHAVEMDKTLARLPHFPSFRGDKWKAKHKKRPYLPPEMWLKVKKAAFERIHEPASNNVGNAARVKMYRQELYAFMMICVGGALRVDEARALTWADCELGKLDGTECVHVWLRSKYREVEDEQLEGWLLYDGVKGWKYLRRLRPNAKPTDRLFHHSHVDEMRNLLTACGCREELVTGMTRNARSLRSTGLSLRLEEGKDPAYNDLARWARTSPMQLMNFYIQCHPEKAVARILGFRGDVPSEMTERQKKSAQALTKVRKQARDEDMADNDDIFGVTEDDHADVQNAEDWEKELPKEKPPRKLRLVNQKG